MTASNIKCQCRLTETKKTNDAKTPIFVGYIKLQQVI